MHTSTEAKKVLLQGGLDAVFKTLYGPQTTEQQVESRDRYISLINTHDELFGKDLPVKIFSTAGRTELGGNHTDHNHGKVLAASINLDTIAVVTPTDDMKASLISEGFPAVTIDLSNLNIQNEEAGTTNALMRGIAAAFKEKGCRIGGFKANTSTNVLKGSGLSSSAAIEVMISTIFNELYNNSSLTPVELAIIGKYAENVYFKKPCGLMDQIACGNGGIVGIDFEDPDNPVLTPIIYDFVTRGYTLLVVDTGGNHADLTPEYAAIPAEMKIIAEYFDKNVCRDIQLEEFLSYVGDLRQKVSDRAILRCYHFLMENRRVELMTQALLRDDIHLYLSLVQQSGDSSYKYLQNLYPSSAPQEQGLPLALALTEQFLQNQGACRVHGGGFAGTIQAYVPNNRVQDYRNMMESVFGTGSVTSLRVREAATGRLL